MPSVNVAKSDLRDEPKSSTGLYPPVALVQPSANGRFAGKVELQALESQSLKTRHVPLVVRANRAMRTVLIGLCGLAILGYGLDVAASNDVGKMQEQARRLSEQNTELSAQLLRVISFQGIADSMHGRCGLRVPDQVMIVKEVQPYPLSAFEPAKHHLPVLSGY